MLMLTALVLICSMAIAPDMATCSGENASSIIRVPQDYVSPVTCLMHGEAYIAETSLGQELAADERVKVICAPTNKATSLVSHIGRTSMRSQ
jgi:hypothetical protein